MNIQQLEYRKRLFITFNQSMKHVRKQTIFPVDKLRERVKKAFSILQTIEYYIEEKAAYQPTEHSCNCKDWEFHNASKRAYTGPCKHMIAETFYKRMMQLQYKQLDFFSLCGG